VRAAYNKLYIIQGRAIDDFVRAHSPLIETAFFEETSSLVPIYDYIDPIVCEMNNENMCVCVCVRVCEREKET